MASRSKAGSSRGAASSKGRKQSRERGAAGTRAARKPIERRPAEPAQAEPATSRAAGQEPAAAGNAGPIAIVGVGASAGGLDAFKRLLGAMPPASGMALVLVQHLAPTHTSLLPELLAPVTKMKVLGVEDGMRVERDHVYVIPPNRYLSIESGRLHLAGPLDRTGPPTTIDSFFRSLAEDQAQRAIGIVLAGVGSEGANGLRAIKAHGGVALAQDPSTTAHDGMPRSAIATGVVDQVLTVEQMPGALARYVQHPYVQDATAEPHTERDRELHTIVALLRTRARADFGSYKKSMLARRVERRMGLKGIARLEEYAQLLRSDPAEVDALCADLLIRVTAFFREPKSWNAVSELALEPIVAGAADLPVRVWTPGCATGEEVYSLAMLLTERFKQAEKPVNAVIFATDVDSEALAIARAGRYPASVAADVSPGRLERFFTREDHHVVVKKEVRELVVFAPQNLIGDPPFSKLDLVVCRNVLIYLEPEMQRRVLGLFHFALRDGGLLFLGGAETVGPQHGTFEIVSKKAHLYRRIGPSRQDLLDPPGRRPGFWTATPQPVAVPGARHERIAAAAHELLVDRFAPAAVLVERRGEILHFSGATEAFLIQPKGPPTRNLMELCRDGLRRKVRAAFHRAIRDDQPATVAWSSGGPERTVVRVTVEPLSAPSDLAGLVLVTFEAGPERTEAGRASAVEVVEESMVHQLEEELRLTRDDLRASLEQLDSFNEELKSAHEEAISTNEELQSTNEELETSKEELQSLNEELSTVNAQLESKVVELEATRDDLQNLLSSSDLATLFLDRNLRIKKFTPAMTRLMRLIASDCGRPLADFGQEIANGGLAADAEAVLRDLAPIEREVATAGGDWYARRVLPYRTTDDRIEGVVITFANITHQKRVTAAARGAEAYAQSIVDTVRDGLLVLDEHQVVVSASKSFYQMFQAGPDQTVGRPLPEIGGGQWDIPALGTMLDDIRSDDGEVHRFVLERELPESGLQSVAFVARRLVTDIEHPGRILVAIEDISERVRLEREEQSLREEMDRRTGASIAALERANARLEEEIGERVALEEELQRIVDSEQRRIGQDLHDEIGQDLTAINYLVHNLRDALSEAGRPEIAAADKVATQVVRVHQRLRAVTRSLVPLQLESQGIRQALESLAEDLSSIYGVSCEVEPDGQFDVTDPLWATNLYRIAQEALTNAVKHARPHRIRVRLHADDGTSVLEVSDDGTGIGGADQSPGRLGTQIMRHRARLIGGELTIGPGTNGGTLVRCVVPAARGTA